MKKSLNILKSGIVAREQHGNTRLPFVVREKGNKNMYYKTKLQAQTQIYKLNVQDRKGVILRNAT